MEKITLPCKHVSHTAWLVAAFRAQESERSDAHFRDPLARVLLSHLEDEYLAGFSEKLRQDPWLLTVRTIYIDKLIMNSLEQGISTVINLGAGLDTRPYRLALPPSLRWFEVDYAEVVTYKNETLKAESPQCKLERIAADLSIDSERQKVLDSLDKKGGKALILTEGLLPYLREQDVSQLARELFTMSSCKYWVMDMFNESLLDSMHGTWNRDMNAEQKGEVSFHFIPEDTISYLKPLGWKSKNFYSFGEGALELRRFPKEKDALSIKTDKGFLESGVCLFEKSDAKT